MKTELQFLVVDFFVYVFDGNDEVLEELFSGGLIEALVALGVVNKFAFKEVLDEVLVDILFAFGAEGFLEGFKK